MRFPTLQDKNEWKIEFKHFLWLHKIFRKPSSIYEATDVQFLNQLPMAKNIQNDKQYLINWRLQQKRKSSSKEAFTKDKVSKFETKQQNISKKIVL